MKNTILALLLCAMPCLARAANWHPLTLGHKPGYNSDRLAETVLIGSYAGAFSTNLVNCIGIGPAALYGVRNATNVVQIGSHLYADDDMFYLRANSATVSTNAPLYYKDGTLTINADLNVTGTFPGNLLPLSATFTYPQQSSFVGWQWITHVGGNLYPCVQIGARDDILGVFLNDEAYFRVGDNNGMFVDGSNGLVGFNWPVNASRPITTSSTIKFSGSSNVVISNENGRLVIYQDNTRIGKIAIDTAE